MDPIDGTKGFLRGDQFAVCLALVDAGRVCVSVIACPNLVFDKRAPDSRGALFVAVAGEGAYQRSFAPDAKESRIRVSNIANIEDAILAESLESSHSSHGISAQVSSMLRLRNPPLRMDSQAKYCELARGNVGLYLRLMPAQNFVERIWDHAAGALLVSEAGGTVSDIEGRPLDFTCGPTLSRNRGIVASCVEHQRVVDCMCSVVQKSDAASGI